MKKHLFHFNNSIILLILINVLLGINSNTISAGNDPKYKVSDIPSELKKGAIAVVRFKEIIYQRKTISDAVYKVKEVITILNKSAISKASFKQYYDKFSKVKKIKVIIYDKFGNIVKKKGIEDIADISAIDGMSLFSDARIKYVDPEYHTIPFTIEFNYEIVYSGTLGTPIWTFYPGYKIAVEKSIFSVITSEQSQLRYFNRNTNLLPTKTVKNGEVTLKWEVENLPPIKREIFTSSFIETTPVILSAPSYFYIDRFGGNANSWESFGKWIGSLNLNRGELPEETILEIKSMLSDSLSELETISLLYGWMQDKTRYVNIKIGIGGWQPILAEDVDRFSYGDCKALSNYMNAILKIADIESYYTLVRAGKTAPEMITEFSCNQFNHAILCVPVENDTVWLECTSQRNPFGYLGSFTDDRDVLLITENGGELAHTKSYDKKDNFKNTLAKVSLDEYGDGTANIDITNSGVYYDRRLRIIMSTEKDRNELIINSIDIPSFELVDYSFDEIKSYVPVIKEDIDLKVKSYATKLGKRLLFEVNLLNKQDYQFKRSGKRKNDIVIRREFKETDTVIFVLPKNCTIESLPSPVRISTKFGDYSALIIADSSQVIYIRNFEMNKGNYPNNSFAEFKQFLNDIKNADKQKVVLVDNVSN